MPLSAEHLIDGSDDNSTESAPSSDLDDTSMMDDNLSSSLDSRGGSAEITKSQRKGNLSHTPPRNSISFLLSNNSTSPGDRVPMNGNTSFMSSQGPQHVDNEMDIDGSGRHNHGFSTAMARRMGFERPSIEKYVSQMMIF